MKLKWKDEIKNLIKSDMIYLEKIGLLGHIFDKSKITMQLFVLTYVVPFILFWAGALLPLFTENRTLFCLSILPFFVWTNFVWIMGGNYAVVFISVHYGFYSSLFITVLYVAAVIITEDINVFDPFFGTTATMAINVFTFGIWIALQGNENPSEVTNWLSGKKLSDKQKK